MDVFSWETLQSLVSTVGFPIFIAVWMLVRSDRRTKELTDAVKQLADTVADFHRRV